MMRHWVKPCSLVGLCLFSWPLLAVDRSRLWLPSTYKQYFSELRKVAELAEEKAPRCVEVVDGTLSESLSSIDKPIFRLICRDENKRTHAMQIDGITFDVVDLSRPTGRVTFEALELERIEAEKQAILDQQEAERQAALLQQKNMWADCLEQLAARTKNMRALAWRSKDIPEPVINEEGETSFSADFDAKDIYSKALHYRGECRYQSLEDVSVKIRPRRD